MNGPPLDLSALLDSSRKLASQLDRQELPHISLGLDQIEDQSKKLVTRIPAVGGGNRANYLLAQARVNVPALAELVTSLNPSQTFAPLQPLRDTDVSGYLRHNHEQALISTIEESRRDTVDSFYRELGERIGRDWEEKKKRIMEELGAERREMGSSLGFGRSTLSQSALSKSTSLSVSQFPASRTQAALPFPVQSRMMAYDRVVSDLNAARLAGNDFPVIHSLIEATTTLPSDTKQQQILQTLTLLASIVEEYDPRSDMYRQQPLHQRHYSTAYLSAPSSQAAKEFRRRVVSGTMKWLEETFLSYLDHILQNNPTEAALGADPTAGNKLRSYLAMKYYEGGRWQSNLEIVRGQPLWAKLYLLLRSGHATEALAEAEKQEVPLNKFDKYFLPALREWVTQSRSVSKSLRDRLVTSFNTLIRNKPTTDPFKHALFKLISRAEPSKRNVPLATETTEDWLWFQFAMVDEPMDGSAVNGGLKELASVVLKYGEKAFDKDGKRPWVWSRMLFACGEFERGAASLHDQPHYGVEGVHIAAALAYYGVLRVPSNAEKAETGILTTAKDGTALFHFDTVIQRYIRHFSRTDPKEALQYVYLISLNSDVPAAAGKEYVEIAQSLCRQIAHESANYEDLLGGVRPDGSRYPGLVEQNMKLLSLENEAEYHRSIVHSLAQQYQDEKRIVDAVKLYNLAEDYGEVMTCLIWALGNSLFEDPAIDSGANKMRELAASTVQRYRSTPTIRERVQLSLLDTCDKLRRVRTGFENMYRGQLDKALSTLEESRLLPFHVRTYDMHLYVEELKREHAAIVQNEGTIIVKTMEILYSLYQRARSTELGVPQQQSVMNLRDKASRLVTFASQWQTNMAPRDYEQLIKLEAYIRM